MTDSKIRIPAVVTVGQFADLLGVPVSKVIAELMKNGVMATINENIDYETAEIIAEFLGTAVEKDTSDESDVNEIACGTDPKNLKPRPPVVAVLGHVDHGKTSLLDKIRETNVVAKESGGITQHIGAYKVNIKDKKLTFLDTPGHEAFEAMRAHGAQITDIAVLIVAADDGIKPQTTEAIKHIKEAGTPMVVAINKIDKPDADPTRIKKQFTEIGLTPQEWGGDLEFVEVSSKTGVGIDKLLDTIIAMSEILNLRADPDCDAQGVVIESKIETGKGPVASVLIQNGKLEIGDWIQVGETYGHLKAMEDETGKRVKIVLPGQAVKISGLKEVPSVAEMVQKYPDEISAKNASEKARKYAHVKGVTGVKKIGLEAISASLSEKKELNLVIKADVVGSLEAIKESLEKLTNQDVGVKFICEGVGSVNENDISMAAVSDNLILAFKVSAEPGAESVAKSKNVKIIRYDVIYELISDVKNLLAEMMPIERTEIPVGRLKVLAVFKSSPQKTVVGGRVEEGRCEKDVEVHVIREAEIIHDYRIVGVQREKDEVASVPSGTECGVSFSVKADIKEGDVLELFRVEEHKKSL